jgi:HEPN domain-containing protein
MNNEIIGKFPSLIGFVTKSYKDGDWASIVTQLSFYNTKNTTDEDITTAKIQIYGMLSQWIFPLILQKFSGQKLPDDFLLYAVYIEMHQDNTKNRILFNEDTKLRILCKLKPGLKFKNRDPVKINDIEEISYIEKLDKDPNAATILLIMNKGDWFGTFDFVYNRYYVKEKCERAIEFLDSAIENYKKSNNNAFYQSLWDCSELLAESLLLLHNQIKLKTPHSQIRKVFKQFCEIYNLPFFDNYFKITEIRNNSRYGPPHPKHSNSEQDALHLLKETHKFFRFVLVFLKERQVEPSSKKFHEEITL